MKSDAFSHPYPSSDPQLENLLHPAQAFERPRDVLADRDLTVNEKRAILASWASDACAVKAMPALRHPLGAREAITVDEILDALRMLDKVAQTDTPQVSWARRQVRREAFSAFRQRQRPDQGSALLAR